MAPLTASTAPVRASTGRVSVALCTYNGTEFLPQLLQSILDQTQLPDELVVCDDRSSDETIPLLERFAQRAPFPVRIFQNPETLRPAQNFARCLALCEGEILVLTDQDDLWFPDRVAETAGAFLANPGLAMTFSECPLIDGQGQDLPRSIYSSLPIPAADRRRVAEGSALLPVLLRFGILYGTTMAVRADMRRLFLPVPAGWSHDEWIGLCLSASAATARLPRPVTHYRQHAAQQVGTGDWTLGTHLGLASDHGRVFYQSELARLQAALTVIAAQPELHVLREALGSKLDFVERRLQIQNGGLRRLPLFLSMLLRGKYRRYASGMRSPVKDFAMMAGGFAGHR